MSAEEQALDRKLSPSQEKAERTWNTLSTLIDLAAKKHGYFEEGLPKRDSRRGSLVVVGSGINCVSQFTLEAVSHIKSAEKVLYCVTNAATAVYILELCPEALDLRVFYDDDKPRYATYVQMSEACLYFARQGLNVVAVFYGHPGVFVLPSHRAIQIAQKEGIPAKMLPGISAEDCLFADVGIDPAFPGAQTLEATDLLLRNRTLLTDLHVVVWQVGCVGDLGFNRKGYRNQNFHLLIERLQNVYGSDYEIVHYKGAESPLSATLVERLPLSAFLQPDIAKQVTSISTFYIPPKEVQDIDPVMAEKLGLLSTTKGEKKLHTPPRDRYGPIETDAISALAQWNVPMGYSRIQMTNIAHYLIKISQDFPSLRQHKSNPAQSMQLFGLSHTEAAVIASGSLGEVYESMKPDLHDIAQQAAIRLVTDQKFAASYAAAALRLKGDPDTSEKLHQWFASHNYDIFPNDMETALEELKKTSLPLQSGRYTTNASVTVCTQGDQTAPLHGKVLVDDTLILEPTFAKQTLSWSSSTGNSSNAELHFITEEPTGRISFTGRYWKTSEPKPTSNNIQGKIEPKRGNTMITGLATAAFAKQVEKQAEIMKLCFNNLEKDQEQIEKTEQQVELALEWLREVETVSTPAVSTAESTSQIIVLQ